MIEFKGIKKIKNPVPPDDTIPNFSAPCPDCGDVLTFIHDLKCPVCDNKTKMWCPTCSPYSGDHYEVLIDF